MLEGFNILKTILNSPENSTEHFICSRGLVCQKKSFPINFNIPDGKKYIKITTMKVNYGMFNKHTFIQLVSIEKNLYSSAYSSSKEEGVWHVDAELWCVINFISWFRRNSLSLNIFVRKSCQSMSTYSWAM